MDFSTVAISATLAERFWSKVVRADGDGCWVWSRARDTFGYGELYLGRHLDTGAKRIEKAHRIAWFLAHGDVPRGRQINHRCDNPPCVRLDHLRLGTALDNATDRMRRGRGRSPGAQGERNAHAKLTEEIVRWARAAWAAGRWPTYAALGRELGCSYQNARGIVRGDTWKLVA